MSSRISVSIFWFRRDLRINNNYGLAKALQKYKQIMPVFIFDPNCFGFCNSENDVRYSFVYTQLQNINNTFNQYDSSILLCYGKPLDVFRQLTEKYKIDAIIANADYEPYEINRDKEMAQFARQHNIAFELFHAHCIFEPSAILKQDGKPYTIFTPYSHKWLEAFNKLPIKLQYDNNYSNLFLNKKPLSSPAQLQFKFQKLELPELKLDEKSLKNYHLTRDYPAQDATSKISIHLRWGTLSINNLAFLAGQLNQKFLNELIWREFYKMVLYFFPNIITHSFKPKYDNIAWLNAESDFEKWCNGNTGYPIVDAGMRQLNETGFMHNRLRMVTASFLCKHLLIDWRWGEAYFAEKLLDFDASANVGGWQWAAGSGCDPVPYFRIFNPTLQAKKYDAENLFIKRWVKEWGTDKYAKPMINHEFARKRCLDAYKKALIG